MILGKMNCELCNAKNCFINNYVSLKFIEKINENKFIINFKQGQYIFSETNYVTGLFFIKKGKVKIFFTRENKDQIIRLANTGDILGHRGFGNNNHYPISAITLIDSNICFIPKKLLIELLQNNPALSYQFTMFYANELMQSEQYWHSLSRTGLRERVINAVLMVFHSFYDSIKDGDVIDLYITRKEIGDIASTSPEQVCREFAWYNEQGIIEILGRRKIIIKDYERLINLVKLPAKMHQSE
ncbi:MAG: hypothetical protein COA97_08980 [Flavobacteriales bacterium]|nr:MAG: hypothetical protein COA97_08980 [Flavobacteriales bacterium]